MGDFQPPVAYVQAMKTALDSYPWDRVEISPETAIAHGVQKDAIQNSLDAEDNDNPQDFGVEFEMRELSSPDIITITDYGTTGLTGGRRLTRSEIRRIIGTDQYPRERWSRFQALGYSHPDDSPLRGARGQGKFIFIGASKPKEMVFDSLRDDGIYRVGHWGVTEDKPIMDPKEGKEAEDYISQYGLEPLEEIGTRVIVPNPKSELWRSFHGIMSPQKCDLYRYISSTWWEAFHSGRSIKIILGDSEKEVKPPDIYKHYETEPDFFDSLTEESIGKPLQNDFPGCIIEELVIAYSEEKLPAELRGIALQRNKMTVERFNPARENTELPSHFGEHIFGWIILNDEGDRELKKTEKSCHYHFNRTKGSLARFLFGSKGWLNEKLEEFAEEQGHGVRGRKLGSAVTTLLNEMGDSFDYKESVSSGTTSTGTSTGIERPGSGKRKTEMYPQVSLDYPRESRRIEFGEKIKNIEIKVRNYAEVPLDFKLQVDLKKKDQETLRRDDEKRAIPFPLFEENGTIDARDTVGPFTKSEIKFDEDRFEGGIYVLEAINQAPSGRYKEEERKLIYLGTDPLFSESGIFKEPEVLKFTGDRFSRKLQYAGRIGKDKKITLFINELHPLANLYKKRGANRPTDEYILQCGANYLMKHDFLREGKIINQKNFNKIKELANENPEQFGSTVEEASRARQELLFDIFSNYSYCK